MFFNDMILMEGSNDDTKRTIYEILFANGSMRINNNTKTIIIKGINYGKFIHRIMEMYESRGLVKLFEKKYTWWSELMWRQRKISAGERKVNQLEVPLFFALEIHELFYQLGEFYRLRYYKHVAKEIYKHTWISKYDKKKKTDLSVSDSDFLRNLRLEPLNYQKEFILNYKYLKYIYDLEGYILSFDQGLGKTFTSIALSELLHKDRIIIVCPNTLKENWAYELKSYYKKYDDDELWKNEIYINDNRKFNKFSKSTKYIIVNQESINKIYPLIKTEMDYMIIVDESHNFRNINSNRTSQLLKLKSLTKCTDNLMMSGTPIKATPNELVPALLMIDPYFTPELAEKYNKTFYITTASATDIVRPRFDRSMYRKTKNDVLSLPEKHIETMRLAIKEPEKYHLDVLKQEIGAIFDKYYSKALKDNAKLADKFSYMVHKYSDAGRNETIKYISYMTTTTNTGMNIAIHDYDQFIYSTFLKDHVYPNIHDDNEYKAMKSLQTNYIYMLNSAIGKANGEVLPKARTNCYIDIYDDNYKYIHKMINDNTKKTIIFTPFVGVCDHIYNDMIKKGIGAVKVDGSTKDRMEEIQRFKNDDTIDVLVATVQTLSVGVTLTEATQMFFFGVPWRSADYNQATDRIHRIGQTHDVYIYNVYLDTDAQNITNSLEDTLEWSGQMFDSIVN